LSFLRYCGRVLHVALSHSLHAAHSIILVLLIVAGLATSLIPSLEIIPDLHGWQVAASVLTAIVGVRLLLAPFWIWQEGRATIQKLEAEILQLKQVDYAHGLGLTQVQPSVDLGNLKNSLELRLQLSNSVAAPLKFVVDRYVQTIGEKEVVTKSANPAVIPKAGQMTFFPNVGFSKTDYDSFRERETGTLAFTIVYGPPNGPYSRRMAKTLHISVFKRPDRKKKASTFTINWIVQTETDEPLS
jgi:hypothetical protein